MDDRLLRRNYLILCLKIRLFTYDVTNRSVLTLEITGILFFEADYIYSPLLVVNTSLGDGYYLQR